MHKSVLLNEVVNGLNIRDGLIYVDCTLGYAGHSGEILKKNKKGWLYAFDQDSDAIEYSTKKLSSIGDNFEIIRSNFVNLKNVRLKVFDNEEKIMRIYAFSLFDIFGKITFGIYHCKPRY